MKKATNSTKYISIKIKELRDECNWSQSKLANEAGITASAISMIESGQRVPSLVVIRKISDALKVSISELTGESTQDAVNQDAQAFFRQFSDLNHLKKSDQQIILDLAKRLKTGSDADGNN